MRKPDRIRLAPFKILSLLMYGSYEWLRPLQDGQLSLHLGQMARDMRVSRDRLREHLAWLEKWEYLTELNQVGPGRMSCRLQTPPNLARQVDAERSAYLEGIRRQEALRSILVEIPEDE